MRVFRSSPSCGDLLQPGSECCNPDGTLTPAGVAASNQCNRAGAESSECAYYLQLCDCFDDCSECERDRCVVYYQTCRNMTELATGTFPGGHEECANSCAFQAYVSDMRRCLQDVSRAEWANWTGPPPISCTNMIEGQPGDLGSGIIGSHTGCNIDSASATCRPRTWSVSGSRSATRGVASA